MFTLQPRPDMWEVPKGARLIEKSEPFQLDATLSVSDATYATEEHVVEPGLLLTVRELFTVLDAALPKCVVGLERNPGGKRPAQLSGLVANGGKFYRISTSTAWEWRQSIRDPNSLRNFTNEPTPLQGVDLVAELQRVTKAGFTADEVGRFAGGELRSVILTEALAAARERLEGMPTGHRAAWLHNVATTGTLPGFGMPQLGGGVDAYLDALGRHLAAAPVVAILAAAEVK